MASRHFSSTVGVAVLVLLGSSCLCVLAAGSTTAVVKGRVVGTDGVALPGVIVRIRSASQPTGNKQAPTDIEGHFRIPLLPPATDYIIRIAYPGFAPVEVGPLDLDTGKTTVQNITLRSAAESTETIIVESRGNIVDTENTQTSTSYNAEFIEGLPIIGGNYQDILTLAPGVTDTDGDGNPNVHGARDTGLQYRLDGGNITDPVSGTFGQNLNPDIIEEVEVITAGASAEFGRADGGFANIITKSGGNDFEGRFSFRYRGKFLDGNGANNNDVNMFDQDVPEYNDARPALSLGGPIVRDKLWYFGSVEIIDAKRPSAQVGNTRIRTARGHNGFAKITWQIDSFNKLAFQLNSDPIDSTGNSIALGTSLDSDFKLSQGGLTPQIKWTSTISPRLLLESQITHFNKGESTTPLSALFRPTAIQRVDSGTIIQALYPCDTVNCDPRLGERRIYQIDLLDGTINGPYFFKNDDERKRNAFKTDLSFDFAGAGGQHNIKSGIEFTIETFHDIPINNPILLDSTQPLIIPGVNLPPNSIEGIQTLQTSEPLTLEQNASSFNSAAYLLDAWKPLANLTINAGIRVDREDIDTSGFDFFDPRQERRNAIALWRAMCVEAIEQGGLVTSTQNCAQLPNNFNGKPPEGAIINGPNLKTFRDDNGDGVNDVDPLVQSLDINGDGVWDPRSGTGPEARQLFRDFTRFPDRQTQNFSIKNTNISPRLSISWDPWADGKTKVFGTWGRFYDRLFLRTVSGEIGPDTINFSFIPDEKRHRIIKDQRSRLASTVSINQVDRDLSTPRTDEITLGIEREISPEWAFSLTYINRRGRSLLQDEDLNHVTCPQFGDVLGINPLIVCGDGGVLETDQFGDAAKRLAADKSGEIGGDFGFDPTPGGVKLPNGAPDLYTVNNGFNQVLRVGNFNSSDYEALELGITKRLQRNWQMQLSYTYSEASGQAETFADTAGNDPETKDDEQGFLDFDQRHVFKLQIVTRLPKQVILGGNLQWASGVPFPLTRSVIDQDSTGNTIFRTFFPTGQRNDQRNTSFLQVDTRLEKRFQIGKVTGSGFFSVENILDNDHLTIIDFDLTSESGIPLEALNDIGRRFEIGAIFNF